MSPLDRKGLTTRIGIVSPDDGVNDDEYNHYLPPGVTLLWTRFRTPRRDDPISVEMVGAYGDLRAVEEAAETLRMTRPEVVVFCCNSCGFVYGRDGDERIRKAVARGSGGEAITITGSQLRALEVLGVKRISVGAPYPPGVTAKLLELLESAGYNVVETKSLGLDSEWQIGNSRPEVWRELVRAVDSPDAECVLLACSGIRAAAIIDSVERELGKPLVAAPAVAMWNALRTAGVAAKLPGRGILFERH